MSDKPHVAAKESKADAKENQGISADAAAKIFSDLLDARMGAIVDAVLAKVGPIVADQVTQAIADIGKASGPSLDELMERIVPRVQEFIATADQRAAAASEAELAAQRAAEVKAAEAADRKRAKAAEKEAAEAAEAAEQARVSAQEHYAALTGDPANVVASALELAPDSRRGLVFADGSSFIASIAPIEVHADELEFTGAHALYNRRVPFSADGPPESVTEAWLLDDAGHGVKCALGGPLTVGNGNQAAIPAGHLIF